MRHLVLTIVAIGIAGVAAIAATTALLNAPLRIGPAASSTPTASQPGQTQAPVEGEAKPATKDIPDAPPPKGAEPQAAPPAGADPAGATPPAAKLPKTPTRIPTKALRPRICRRICNTTPMPA